MQPRTIFCFLDDVNLIVEIIQLCDYTGCAALEPEFVKQLDLQKNNTTIKNVIQLFAASKNLNSIVGLKVIFFIRATSICIVNVC